MCIEKKKSSTEEGRKIAALEEKHSAHSKEEAEIIYKYIYMYNDEE